MHHGHPQQECRTDVVVADQRQSARAERDHDEGVTEPQAGDRIKKHDIEGPERNDLARPEMTEHDRAEDAERGDQQEGEQ